MAEPVVHVENLTRRFGDFIAVDHISFDVQQGEIVGYLGPNGCGKTTTIRMLLGLLKPDEGLATVLGYDTFKETEDVRARVGYMSQKFAIYDDLTVKENLTFYAGTYGITDTAQIDRTADLVGLEKQKNIITRSLSAGWRQRLALAIALVHQPRLLFLDEPTSGVDPNARRDFWDLIYTLAEEGVTVLVTTHYMDEAEYCHRVGIMRAGKLLAIDTPLTLKDTYVTGAVYEVYTSDLIAGLEALHESGDVALASLAGDHIRLVLQPNVKVEQIKSILSNKNLKFQSLLKGEPTLEDVFTTLAR
jgi:ABC-2 type transport system ATP-binding protein